jgi:hypothetical protein
MIATPPKEPFRNAAVPIGSDCVLLKSGVFEMSLGFPAPGTADILGYQWPRQWILSGSGILVQFAQEDRDLSIGIAGQ